MSLKEKLILWGQKLALKAFIKGCNKLVEKGVKLDLDEDDVNDLIEWREWCEKALEVLNKKK